jgi:hypothetical protein
LSRCNSSNGIIAIHARWKKKVAVPTTVHCDHLIQAKVGATTDLAVANSQSKEVFDFFLQFLINTVLVFGSQVRELFTKSFRKLCFPRRNDDWY